MRQRPTGDELLTCARNVLKKDVLPALPPEHRHALLMTMNAMSIAERQLRNGDRPEAEELAELRTFFDDQSISMVDAQRRLAREIRTESYDPGSARRNAVFAQLRAAGRRRLAESNPKALPAAQG